MATHHDHQHTHNHSQVDKQDHSQSAAERNRAYFSSPSQIYLQEKAFLDAFASKWTDELLTHESWLDLTYQQTTSQPLKMLDYACGPGMASFAALKLSPSLSNGESTAFNPIFGIDIADGMVQLFNERVTTSPSEIPAGTVISAYRGDFVSPESPTSSEPHKTHEPPDEHSKQEDADKSAISPSPVSEASSKDPRFSSLDLVTCILAVHHFADPAIAIARLAERLQRGGILFICDMVPGDIASAEDVWLGKTVPSAAAVGQAGGHGHGHEHGHGHGHGHHHGHDHATAVAKEGGASNEDTGLVHSGFTKTIVEDIFALAGLVSVRTRLMDLELAMPESMAFPPRKMFWAIGRRR